MATFNYITGVIHWAKVLGDPVPNYNRDGNEWTFDFTPDKEGLKVINGLGIGDKMKNKGDDRGEFIQFKQKEKRADGGANFPITVVDARNRPWDPAVKIGNGSLGEVKFKVVDYGKGKPKGVYVQAIRVLDLKEYVRQEFAPLPEDSPYAQNFDEPVEVEATDAVEGDPLDA